jgi:outer membrane protein OmpA-like peptidoglycan-associated protein
MQMLQVGLAAGTGFVRQAGTPDFRLLARIAYAPMQNRELDTDGDGIADRYDACPTERGVPTGNPRTHGCPPIADRDHDGVPDAEDVCPDEHKGPRPDPMRLGCPTPATPTPAPIMDRDGDGVPDAKDQCPDQPMGQSPDPNRLGCPAADSDKDGVLDPVDQCLFEPAGAYPDPHRLGCPLPDRDKDTVPDAQDACPDQPGAPSPDPKKNGCPGLVEVKNGQLVILKPVFFALDKDVILPKSFPVLQAVADAMKAAAAIKKIRIEGHTDSQGNPAYNIDLSERRTKSVRKWLIEHAIAEDRLETKGYGQLRPIDTNKTVEGRAKNRRVEFHIVDGSGTVDPAH